MTDNMIISLRTSTPHRTEHTSGTLSTRVWYQSLENISILKVTGCITAHLTFLQNESDEKYAVKTQMFQLYFVKAMERNSMGITKDWLIYEVFYSMKVKD